MREILFRGKRIDNGKWVYGFYGFKPNGAGVDERFVTEVTVNTSSNSVFTYFTDVLVTHETVGQYTGLEDKNGVKIFDGDIVKATQKGQTKNGVVVYREGGYFWEFETDQYGYLGEVVKRWHPEVIGNVTDNPELMELG